MDIRQEIEKKHRKPELPQFNVGDTVDVEVSISESGKERIQIFSGVVISIKGKGINRTFTVRRIVQGEGVERTFPFHSPKIGDVRVKKAGMVRRAKLYYLRKRTGKGTRIKEMTGAKKKTRVSSRKKEKAAEAASVTEEAVRNTSEELAATSGEQG